MTIRSTLRFELPPDRVAATPPEARGLHRDEVKLMVARSSGLTSGRFVDLASFLNAGDIVVVNTSPTMRAALTGTYRHERIDVHLSTMHDDGSWTVELRRADRTGPIRDAVAGTFVEVPHGTIELLRPEPGEAIGAVRLWRGWIATTRHLRRLLRRHGKPIRYGYVTGEWPLEAYQTVFADRGRWPGSAEMASAGRPFSARVVKALHQAGVDIVGVTLDTGVSSQEGHEPPQRERFSVSAFAAGRINAARLAGGRVIAVGTTVTRALETASDEDGTVHAAGGWTDLVLDGRRPTRTVEALITGWHPPEASHLDLLTSVAGPDLVERAYRLALESGYRWHEFGDSCLLLPD